MKFVYTLCKDKCKNKYTYMVLHGCVKKCKRYDFYLGGGARIHNVLVIGQPNGPLPKKKPIKTCTHN
jgi:hypothetical protein